MPEVKYENLNNGHPEWGQVGLIPWDIEIFGFPVADFRVGDARAVAKERAAFSRCMEDWALANSVELVGCSFPATDLLWYTLLPALGFAYVDYTLSIVQPGMDMLELARPHLVVREAQAEDRESVERIAERAFRAGRYYADPLFPRALVDRRYKQWVGSVFRSFDKNNLLLVTGDVGEATGFAYLTLTENASYIQIIAVAPEHQRGITAIELISGIVRKMNSLGIKKVSSKISALNSPVMNVASFFKMSFGDPQVVFHWHAPNAPHLNSWESVFESEERKD